ncbi:MULTISPECIES: leucine efflux protein LeuE [Rhodoferax]|uniref:Leucine efflux protein LeuE n=1 Tax=Rhodoferax fermentans TaxID=28066 RepID=A0A1T1ANB7_RHOFE|nr:leucine efflux protein LeuE [Rhodoferax fermentans]MBK1684432.1 leucine efflux protein LeuE [Rhodoferax fermentans]OOV05463.1 leucine efflux protein LeuE [Rhodoferax fermentans]
MSFYGVTDLWTYVVGAFGIILLPGPNSLYVLSVATARGVRAGYQGALGVFVGDTVLLICTALGAASLLRTHPALFLVVKYAGAAYLFWVGLNLMWGALKGLRANKDVVQATVSASAPATAATAAHLQQPFRRALVISLLNPKAILFLLSFFVQFIDPTYAQPEVPFLILSAILMSFSAAYLTALIFAGARLAQTFRQRKRLSSGLSSLVGALFVWFGSKLATASLN